MVWANLPLLSPSVEYLLPDTPGCSNFSRLTLVQFPPLECQAHRSKQHFSKDRYLFDRRLLTSPQLSIFREDFCYTLFPLSLVKHIEESSSFFIDAARLFLNITDVKVVNYHFASKIERRLIWVWSQLWLPFLASLLPLREEHVWLQAPSSGCPVFLLPCLPCNAQFPAVNIIEMQYEFLGLNRILFLTEGWLLLFSRSQRCLPAIDSDAD